MFIGLENFSIEIRSKMVGKGPWILVEEIRVSGDGCNVRMMYV